MGFFPNCEGAISYSAHLKPSYNGVLISLRVKNLDETLKAVLDNGGATIIGKTAIAAENKGFCSIQ